MVLSLLSRDPIQMAPLGVSLGRDVEIVPDRNMEQRCLLLGEPPQIFIILPDRSGCLETGVVNLGRRNSSTDRIGVIPT